MHVFNYLVTMWIFSLRFMYPQRFLSSHFLTEHQKAELVASGHQKLLDKTRILSEALQQGEDDGRLNFLREAGEMVMSRILHAYHESECPDFQCFPVHQWPSLQ